MAPAKHANSGREVSPVGRPDFKSGRGREPVLGGFELPLSSARRFTAYTGRRAIMTPAAAFQEQLKQAAELAAVAESDYRREAWARIAVLERGRAFAFRRANLMRAIGEAVRGSADDSQGGQDQAGEEMAIARALAMLRTHLGWPPDSEGWLAVLSRFAPLAATLYRASWPSGKAGPPGAGEEITGALDAFECWYEETYGTSFWSLFENELPETPLVDF